MTVPAVPRPASGYREPQQIQVDGADIALRREGTGEPVLYLHGHFATRQWLPLHQRLAQSVDLVAPELPGFGESELPAWVGGREDVVLLYRDLLDVLELPAVHLVGYGLGGWLAADFAVWFPDRVRSLALLAPYGLRVPDQPIANIFLMNPAEFPTAYGLSADSEHVPGVGTPDQGGSEEWAHRYGEMGAAARLMWQRRYDVALDHRLPRLAARRLPALVVGAENDKIVPAPHLGRWAELLDARNVLLPGGHAFPLTEPELTASAVTDLIRETSS